MLGLVEFERKGEAIDRQVLSSLTSMLTTLNKVDPLVYVTVCERPLSLASRDFFKA
jgi:hypothetical protein